MTYDYKMGETVSRSLEVHRTVAGKMIRCHANASDKTWFDAATAACKSLRAAG